MKPRVHGPIAIDRRDARLFQKHRWYRDVHGYLTRRVLRDGSKSSSSFHREVMDAPSGLVVDHISGDVLDNRRCNLRVCTKAQNGQNSRKRSGDHGRPASSPYKGVSRHSATRWGAFITDNGKVRSLGAYVDEVEAARAYDAAAAKLFGPFARLNFPQERAA